MFAYNVVSWGRVGAELNDKLQESKISLEEIETIISIGDRLRWLPIEIIQDTTIKSYLTQLDELCGFPKVQHKIRPPVIYNK